MLDILIVPLLALICILLGIVLVRSPGRSEEKIVKALRDELRADREETRRASRELRTELSNGMRVANETLSKTLSSMGTVQQSQLEVLTNQLKGLTESNSSALDKIRATLDARVKEIREGNEKKLEEMRKTVDEKLHGTLEKRLGESFKLVSGQLEAVQKGLGEMQTLAAGVGDLKRALTNVKVRGTWAEVQLGAILEQILIPSQYEKNVKTVAESSNSVEYAVRLPGPDDDPGKCVWLPIDSKFPQEDYLRIQEAAEKADAQALRSATDALARTVKSAARDIHDKYVSPPGTTDFAIMFLATEGLFAEVLRQPGLLEDIQHSYRVVIAGPTTLAATLSSLRVGFQTLAIEERSADVWKVLAAVKTEFGKFGAVLDKVKRQLAAAANTIEQTDVRTRAMQKRLRSVEQLPDREAREVLRLTDAGFATPGDQEEQEVTDEEIESGPDGGF